MRGNIMNRNSPSLTPLEPKRDGTSAAGFLSRRQFTGLALGATARMVAGEPASPPSRIWRLGLNTYCLRFQRWTDLQHLDYCKRQKVDAVFLQSSLDPGVMDPGHWARVRAWSKEMALHLETGGGVLLPASPEAYPQAVSTLRKNIERAAAMGSPIVRTLIATDRYHFPPGPVDFHKETVIKILREVRNQVMDAGLKIALENHKDLLAWETREVIEAAGKEFVGSYLDTGNPVFVAEDPMTTIEELGRYAVTFHLRDSVVYEADEGVAVQWVPLGEGTPDFKAIVARAAEIMPANVRIYCKPITARPPVILPVFNEQFWTNWFPRGRSRDFSRFLTLAKRGRPYNRPHLLEDTDQGRDRHMGELKVQQLEHMERSLDYCRRSLNLGVRWRV